MPVYTQSLLTERARDAASQGTTANHDYMRHLAPLHPVETHMESHRDTKNTKDIHTHLPVAVKKILSAPRSVLTPDNTLGHEVIVRRTRTDHACPLELMHQSRPNYLLEPIMRRFMPRIIGSVRFVGDINPQRSVNKPQGGNVIHY